MEQWVMCGIIVGIALGLIVVYWCGIVKDIIEKRKQKRRSVDSKVAPVDPDGFAPSDEIYITGGEEQGRRAFVTEAGMTLIKGTIYVSVVFEYNKFNRTDFQEHGWIEKEYCWNVTRKGGYKTNGTNESKLS